MKDSFTNKWITANSIEIVSQYKKGILTLRSLHYQLVGRGMKNDIQHYKRAVNAMIEARWNNQIAFDTFSDLDRAMVGETSYKQTMVENEIDKAQFQIQAWMRNYSKNRWENQPYYPEIFIEKKALQGVFGTVCEKWDIGLGACKGYPSLTFLHEAYKRFQEAEAKGKRPIILYFGDYDPSGEDIPRSIKENIERFGVKVEVRRIALMENQVIEWGLPPAPVKSTDTRTANWDGVGQVELDAVKPEKLMEMCKDALEDIFQQDLFEKLLVTEQSEYETYRLELKKFINELKD